MFIILIMLAYVMMFFLAIQVGGGLKTGDYGFHMDIITRWLNGENPLLDPRNVNGFPYGPYSHVLVATLSRATGIAPDTLLAYIQVIIYPLVIFSLYYFVFSFRNKKDATTTLLLALCGFAFWDRPSQIIPHAIDTILLPIMFYAYLRDRNRLFVIVALSLIYNHLFYMLFPVAGLFLHSLIFKRDRKRFTWVGLGCLPMAYLLFPYWLRILLFPSLNEYYSPQYIHIARSPLWGVAYLGYPLAFASLWGLISWLKRGVRGRDPFEWVALFWVGSFLPLFLQFPHRALTYMAPPLAIVGGLYCEPARKNNYILFVMWGLYFVVEMAFFFKGVRVGVVNIWYYLLIGWTNITFN